MTTLQDRHVRLGASGVRFRFKGKSGVEHEISVSDPALARIVRRCRDLPGQELFQYLDQTGRPAAVDSADVNAYIREATGEDFTAKDFRTWAGTVLAAIALCRGVEAAPPTRRSRAGARSRPPDKRQVVRALSSVAERLGNTLAVCRKSYVHPAVVSTFLDGRLPAAMSLTEKNGSVLGARRATHRAGLGPEEKAVLRLLRLQRAEEKRGDALVKALRRSLRVGGGPARVDRARRARELRGRA